MLSTFLTRLIPALALIALLIPPVHSNAQTAFTAASGRYVNNNQVREWSVGEMCAISTAVAPQLIVTQGFLQPQLTAVATNEANTFFSGLHVQPNPTMAIATLTGRVEAANATILFELMDTKAASVLRGQIVVLADGSVSQDIDLTEQPSGVYFLHLITSHFHSTLSLIKL